MILLDTGPIVAFFDASDNYHNLCIDILKSIDKPLVTTWPVLTESFYLLGFSFQAQDNLWEFIIRGGVEVLSLSPESAKRCRELMKKYRDLPMDLADGTLVAIAEQNGIQEIFTLDKDFSVYRLPNRKKFKILPVQRSDNG